MPESGTVIEDTAGNDALAFTDFEVDNNSTADGTPPIPASAEVGAHGSSLALTFNENLDIGPVRVPPASCVHRQGRRRRGAGAIRGCPGRHFF